MVGPTWTRVHLTLGSDYLPVLSQGTALPLLLAPCLLHCLLVHVRCQMIQGCTSISLPFSRFVYAALGAILLDHMCIHLHGSLYPMMDNTLRVCYVRAIHPMSADVPWGSYDSFTISWCTGFAVLYVMTPPMVGPTWPRVRSILGLDCLPALSQGTTLLRLDYGLTSHRLHCYRTHPMSRD